mmetsp:Transcript_61970/g.135729  ORF Transcript_61970/g.135729 Transcript_61970/m.135729 type:complete len:214 (-) Transcript_61970:9-650(-)
MATPLLRAGRHRTCPTLWHNGPRLVRSPRQSDGQFPLKRVVRDHLSLATWALRFESCTDGNLDPQASRHPAGFPPSWVSSRPGEVQRRCPTNHERTAAFRPRARPPSWGDTLRATWPAKQPFGLPEAFPASAFFVPPSGLPKLPQNLSAAEARPSLSPAASRENINLLRGTPPCPHAVIQSLHSHSQLQPPSPSYLPHFHSVTATLMSWWRRG